MKKVKIPKLPSEFQWIRFGVAIEKIEIGDWLEYEANTGRVRRLRVKKKK